MLTSGAAPSLNWFGWSYGPDKWRTVLQPCRWSRAVVQRVIERGRLPVADLQGVPRGMGL